MKPLSGLKGLTRPLQKRGANNPLPQRVLKVYKTFFGQ